MSPREPSFAKKQPTRLDSTLSSTAPSSSSDPEEKEDNFITILGLGSLLSEKSSRSTFPNLTNFRLGRVPNYRRVFGHPTSIFFQRNIVNGLEMSSLCAEPCRDDDNMGFVCSVFEVPNDEMMNDGIPSEAFLEREEEFDIVTVPFIDLQANCSVESKGILCTKSTDKQYIERWGSDRFQENYQKYGIESIWGWERDSGLRPCRVYLRHCVLAAKNMGEACYDSFLDETFLVDRSTTIRQYLKQYPEVMMTEPPPSLAHRYSG